MDHDDSFALRQALVEKLKGEGHIRSPAVEAAFRAVPRHLFVPGVPLEHVYADEAIITRRGEDGLPISSSSQPAAMAIMLEQLGLAPGQRVLEIGAGTGYNAALIAHIVGESGQVVTVDIDQDIVDKARERLATAGFDRVRVVRGDGGLGYSDSAPYDRIILAVGAWDIAPAWSKQLKSGGRLLLPLWIRGCQKTIAFEAVSGSQPPMLQSVSVSSCGFLRLRGAFAGPEAFLPLGPQPGLCISAEDRSQVDMEACYGLLTGPSQDFPTGVQLTAGEIWDSLNLWLALREHGYFSLSAEGALAWSGIVPYLAGSSENYRWTVGVLGEGSLRNRLSSRHAVSTPGNASLCILLRPPDQSPSTDQFCDTEPFDLLIRVFGSDETLAHHLRDQIIAWDAAGRPAAERLRVKAYPCETP